MANDTNRLVIIGRLTREVELKSLPSGSYVSNFSIAVNRVIPQKDADNKEEVSFFNCVAFGKLAEVIAKYAVKGKRVGIDGRIQQQRWKDQDGKERSDVKIIVENFQFLDVKQAADGHAEQPEPHEDLPQTGSYTPDDIEF